MNNKKIIFGILLFCAISFIAYTFANPLEKEEDEGKLVPGSNQVQTTPKEDDDKDKEPTEPVVVEPTEPVTDDTQNQTSTIANNNKKSIDEIAYEVIAGKWGNGTDRNNRLKNAGYDPVEVQRRVDEILASRNQGNSGNSGNNNEIPVTGVTVSVTNNTTLIPGKTVNLGVSVKPDNATNKNVSYKSSNENVVKVDANGNITAVGAGTATITITTNNGMTQTITIIVLGNMVSKITALSTVSNTIITSAAQGNTSLALKGTVQRDTNHAIDIKIFVPKEYTTDMLKNLKYHIMTNEYGMGVADNTYSGISRIQDFSKLSSGEAYVIFPLEFDDDVVIGRDGSLKIAIDWLGYGNPIIYSIDFSGIQIQ